MLKRRHEGQAAAHGLRLSLQFRMRSGEAKLVRSPGRVEIGGDEEDLLELADLVVRRFGFAVTGSGELESERWVDLVRDDARLEAGFSEGHGLSLNAENGVGEPWLEAFLEAFGAKEEGQA